MQFTKNVILLEQLAGQLVTIVIDQLTVRGIGQEQIGKSAQRRVALGGRRAVPGVRPDQPDRQRLDHARQRARGGGVVTALPTEVDIAILGGGVAGLTLALQLHRQRPGTRIAVLERQHHPVPETTHKVGESTVEIAGYYLRQVLGLQEHLKTEQLDKFGLRVFFSHDGNDDITRRVELGHSVRPPGAVGTYQLDRGRLENALGRMLVGDGVQFLSGVKVEAVELEPESEHHRVTVRDADNVTGEIQASGSWTGPGGAGC